MIVEVVICTAWWCECGHYVVMEPGAKVLADEHADNCSFANRFGHPHTWTPALRTRFLHVGRLAHGGAVWLVSHPAIAVV